MTKEILNFKQHSIFDRLFILSYFIAIVLLIPDCVVATYLPSTTSYYGYWNLTGGLSGLGIAFLVINILWTVAFLSLIIARYAKKPWIVNADIKQAYEKRLNTYLKFNLPVLTCLWVTIIIGLINQPGLITFDTSNTFSFLFQTPTSYFEPSATVVFIIIAMLWLGIFIQYGKDLTTYLKQRKYHQQYGSEYH